MFGMARPDAAVRGAGEGARPSGSDAEEEVSWPCRFCTYHNKRVATECALCGRASGWREEEGAVCSPGGAAAGARAADGEPLTVAQWVMSGALRGVLALFGSVAGALAGALAAHSSRGGGILRGIGLGALAGAMATSEAFEGGGRAEAEAEGPKGLSPERLAKLPFERWEGEGDKGAGEGTQGERGSEERGMAPGHRGRGADGRGTQCPICFEAFRTGEHVRCLPTCQHNFHARCLDPWLKHNASCPMCRRAIVI